MLMLTVKAVAATFPQPTLSHRAVKNNKKWTIKVREERHLHASFTHEDPTTMKCGEIYSCPPSHYNRRHTVGG